MWDRARTSLNVFGGTIWAIPKPLVMACRGLWSTVKAFLVAPKRQKESDITNLAVVAMNSSAWVCSAVAAATGPGFKSRRPHKTNVQKEFKGRGQSLGEGGGG